MIETIVFSMVMIPLLLLSLWLGRLADLRQQTHAAARQLVFDCSVRTRDCIDPGAQADMTKMVVQRMLTPTSQSPLLERQEDIVGGLEPSRFDAGLAQALGQGGRTVANAAEQLSKISGPDRFGLQLTGGLWVAKVRATSASSARPATDLAKPAWRTGAQWVGGAWASTITPARVVLPAQAALLTDPWAASMPNGPDWQSVEHRLQDAWGVPSVGGFSSDGALSAWSQPVRLLLRGTQQIGLESRNVLRYHEFDWDRVPADRLGPAEAQR